MMYPPFRYWLFLIGILLPNFFASAQKKWTIDDILRTERIVSAVMSPDGKYIFYQTGFTADGYYPVKPSKFYVVTTDGKSCVSLHLPLALTSADPYSRWFRWSPDSKYISYFVASASQQDSKQVWAVAPTGGEPLRLTHADEGVTEYEWSPDGSKLLYVTNVPASQEEIDYRKQWGRVLSPEERTWPRKKVIRLKDLSTGSVSQLTDAVVLKVAPKWSPDGGSIAFVGADSADIPQLFMIELGGMNRPEIISSSKEGVCFFSWSPHGRAIAYITAGSGNAPYANYHENVPLLPGNIWLYDTDGKTRKITEMPFPQLTHFKWSNDGSRLAFISQAPETASSKEYNRYIQLYMYVISVADGGLKILAKGMDFFRGGENMTWSGDDKEIWFANGEGVAYNLFAAEVATGKVRHVTTGKDCVNLPSFNRAFTKVSFIRQSVNMKPDIYVSDIASWHPKRLTDINPWVREYANEQGEIVTYNSEGWEIEALLIKPPGFDKRKKYPLIVVVHGGPNWHKLNEWQPDWEQYPLKAYAAEGYVMLFPNFRGSANYGVDFIKTTHHDLGGMDFRDVMRGVDYLLEQGYIDEERMGICGWSYGGFLTPTIITRTNRFKAAQFGAGLPSIEGMYASLWTVERILHKAFDAYPWDNGAMHIQYSPLYHANKVKTPTLIQHGDKDPRCPVGGAVLFYKALKSYGVPTVLEIYPGMGHSITDPLLYKRILVKNLEWFGKWLKNDTTTSFEASFPYTQYRSYHADKE